MLNCVLIFIGSIQLLIWNCDGAVFIKRYRRQLIPLEHVQVHSVRSNVTVLEDTVVTRSLDSILEFDKAPYNLSYFSHLSLASFDSKASFLRVNGSFSDLAVSLYGVHLRCLAAKSSLDLRMNPNEGDESEMRAQFADSVDFGVSDERFNLAIFNGTAASLRARTGSARNSRVLRFGYENSTDEFRVNFVDETANVDVTVRGELIHLTYGQIIVQVDRHFRRLILLSPSHRIEFHTLGATFQASITQNSLNFDFLKDRIRVGISNNSPNISINIQTPSKSDLDRSHGVDINFNGESNNVDHLQLIAKVLQLQLLADPMILANANNSVLSLTTNKTEVKLSATNQLVQISGQTPLLITTTENVAMVITGRGNGTITPPHILEPQVDYAGYDLQNLTSFSSQQQDSHWLTSKLNLNELMNQEISNIEDFPPVLGQSFRGEANNNWADWTSNPNGFIDSNTDLLFPTENPKDTFTLFPFEGVENLTPDNDDSLFNDNGEKLPEWGAWPTYRPMGTTLGPEAAGITVTGQPEYVSGEEPKNSSESENATTQATTSATGGPMITPEGQNQNSGQEANPENPQNPLDNETQPSTAPLEPITSGPSDNTPQNPSEAPYLPESETAETAAGTTVSPNLELTTAPMPPSGPAGQQNADNDLFPTPPSLEKSIAETGFPIPPMPGNDLAQTQNAAAQGDVTPQMEKNIDTGDVSSRDQTYDRNEDTFAIAHFGEVSTPLPAILATIVNITFVSPTTVAP
ncbi:unnamed protein product [Bursaphelenchus xylophilus]|uniref:(pine wood nematode) hypothetical protein n=1 Tax=Bursaphelenchus xylophilus TaxID=6326 RepID=A0A1I7S7N7_BURXY|nr:unnamed protein product [Bursaphelenchus xylophilus]CAG9112038.1 unnamed protein product [Bursaphelenchus xylophilus]